jgi:hypothetical protein
MFRRKKKLALMDLRIYKYWQALYLSSFSSRLYIDVAKHWKGFGFMYGLLLLGILLIPYAIKSSISLNNYIGYNIIEPVSKIPEFKVIDGKVNFDKNMPYFIKNRFGKISGVIDATDTIMAFDDRYPDLLFIVNKTKLSFRTPKLEFLKNDKKNQDNYKKQDISEHDLSSVSLESFDGETFVEKSGFYNFRNLIIASVYPFVVFSFFGLYIVCLLAFSLMGQFATYAIFKHKLKFMQTSRVMVVSSGVGLAVFLTLRTMGINTFQSNVFCIALVSIYFSYAVLAIKRDSRRIVRA